MRYSDYLWLAPLAAALSAGSADAQLLSAVKPPLQQIVKSVKPTAQGLIAAPRPALTSVVTPVLGTVQRTVGSVTTLSSPLLGAPLGVAGATVARPTASVGVGAFDIPAFVPSIALPSLSPLPTQTALADARIHRLQALISANPSTLDTDDLGRPIVRGEIIALDAAPSDLAKLEHAGFRVLTDVVDGELGFRRTTLAAPLGKPARSALRELRAITPAVQADYDHVYETAGGPLRPAGKVIRPSPKVSARLIGMIDGGVAAHPALAGRVAAQRGFAGGIRPTGHGTSVASLLVGRQGRFSGSANGAALIVADVYGTGREAGSASAISDALSWLAARRPQVINVSLVGPPNLVVRRAIAAVQRKGIPIVAAVGNDGPASPPQYPASYPGVISITGVDARGVALFESGNATHVDFAAPGADMAAARAGGGYMRVRGTSFASPLVAGRLAMLGSVARLAVEARPGKGRVGRGIVCMNCRVDPRLLGAN